MANRGWHSLLAAAEEALRAALAFPYGKPFREGMSERSGRSRSAAMGAGWPVAVGTRPCGCGTCTTAQPSPWCCAGMSERSGRSRSAAMGAGWPVAVGTRPCGCGTCTAAQPSPWCCAGMGGEGVSFAFSQRWALAGQVAVGTDRALWDMHNRTAKPVVLRRHASAVWAGRVQQRWALAGQWQWGPGRAAVGHAQPRSQARGAARARAGSLGGRVQQRWALAGEWQ